MNIIRQKIFVFGSNKLGIHGAGAALLARRAFGAQLGCGKGPTGRAYAIPTKEQPTKDKRQIPLEEIFSSVKEFLQYAVQHPELDFQVSPIGCGLAGYTAKEIAPMFKPTPSNVFLPLSWYNI